MGEQKNTVVINGKTYDASTGALLSSSPPTDNVVVTDIVSSPLPIPVQVKSTESKAYKVKRQPQHIAHHKVQKSVTLKRTAKSIKPTVSSSKSIPIKVNQTVVAGAEKLRPSHIDRHQRAKSIDKSQSISRFGTSATHHVSKRHEDLPVKPAPKEQISYHQAPPVPQLNANPTNQDSDIFNAALSQADSHNQPAHKVSKRKHRLAKKLGVSSRAANVIAVIAIITALGSFIAYQNAANLSMRMAVNKSGVAGASLPSYQPSGFSLNNKVTATPGQVVLSFHSNSDDRAFDISQASSSWNSQTLADSYLGDKQAQRVDQSDGKTVYIYDGSNATWVDGGVWYKIEGNSSLTSEQLLNIASTFN